MSLLSAVAAVLAIGLPAAGTAAAETIVVTGSREPLAVSRLAADVVVIDSDTIRGSTADSLADLLRREAGVQLSRNGGPGHSTGVLLRGSSAAQSVVLVDGVRIGSATLGFAALEGLSLAEVERIEVLRGPGSSLYGADAVGGVVQIFTRGGADSTSGVGARTAGPRFDARVAVGRYASRETSAGVRGVEGAWDYALSLSNERSDGVSALRPGDQFGNYNPDRDGYQLGSAQLRLGWRPARGQRFGITVLGSRLNSQYDSAEYSPPTFAPDPRPDFRTRQATNVAALDWRGELGATLVASARASRSVDDAKNGANQIDRFRTTRQRVSAQLAWASGAAGQVVVAVEQGTDRAQAAGFDADVERRNSALVAELTGAAGPWSWQGDLRSDDPSDFKRVGTGRLGGAYQIAPRWKLRALAGTTFRAPSFNDLSFPGYGVPTLQPERGRSVEIGLAWRGDSAEAAITSYRNRVRDLIGYQSDRRGCPPQPQFDFGCAGNIARATLQGTTLSGAQRFGALALRAQLDLLQARDDASGARLARRAAHQGSLAADWMNGDWSVGAALLNLGARPDGGKQLAAETTLDLQTTWRFSPAWSLQAKLLNAGNRDTEPARDYQGLGRQAWLVLRYGM